MSSLILGFDIGVAICYCVFLCCVLYILYCWCWLISLSPLFVVVLLVASCFVVVVVLFLRSAVLCLCFGGIDLLAVSYSAQSISFGFLSLFSPRIEAGERVLPR